MPAQALWTSTNKKMDYADRMTDVTKAPEPETLEQLLRLIADNRDRKAFERLFAQISTRLKSYAMRQGADSQEAEEIVQESLLAVWHKAHQFDSAKASASTWLYTIVRNKRIDFIRRNKLDVIYSDDIFVDETTSGPEVAVNDDLQGSALRNLLTELPDEQRQVLYKMYFEDKSHGIIAEEMGLPLGTVKSRIRLAMAKLDVFVKERMTWLPIILMINLF